jgi:YVTN family beta-propeller protein
VTLSPDASRAYVTGMAGSVVRVIDTATMKQIADVEVGLAPHGVRTNTAGDEVYVSVASSDEIVVIDAGSNTVKRREKVGESPFWVVVGK